MSPSKLQSKNKTQNSKISTHERVGSYTHSSRKAHLPQAQANIQLQQTTHNSFTTQSAHQPTHTSHPIALKKRHHYFKLELTHTASISFQKPLKSLTPPMKLNFHLLRTKIVNMKIFKNSFQVQAKFEKHSKKDMTKFLKPFRTLKSATNDNNSNHQQHLEPIIKRKITNTLSKDTNLHTNKLALKSFHSHSRQYQRICINNLKSPIT